MKYHIGQIASLIGISIEGLRKYENAGLIAPTRTEDSQYRQYSYLDLTSLIRTRRYRALGFSVKEIARLTNEASIDETVRILQSRSAEIHSELRMAESKVSLLNQMCADTTGIDERLNLIEIGECPAFYRMEFSENGEISDDRRVKKAFQRLMNCMPFVYISSRYHGADVYGGIAIEAQYAKLFGLEENEILRYHPSCLSLRMVVSELDNGYSDVSCVSLLKEFAQRHQFTLEGDMIGHTVTGINKRTAYRRYRKIMVKISY